jgi:DNA repair protein RadC
MYEIFRNFWDKDTLEHIEQMKLVLLNRSNCVLGIADISSGGVAGTVCDPKLIFQYALTANASSIILCHSHPSGNLSASNEDIAITKKIKEGAKFLDITLLDHLIITSEGYLSLADEGLVQN